MPNPLLMSVLFVCGLLLVGVLLRATVRPLRVMFVPASVVGGLIGLAVLQTGLRVGPGEVEHVGSAVSLERFEMEAWQADYLANDIYPPPRRYAWPSQHWSADLINTLSPWAGILIAVVFAGLLIEKPGKRFSEAIVRAGRQGIVVWIIVLGQVFLGLLAAALFIAPFYEIPPPFGQLIETGFAGGHGTAAAMGQVFTQSFAFPVGQDLSFLFATFGLVWGTLSGIALINLGVRMGWVSPRGTASPGAKRSAAEEKPWPAEPEQAEPGQHVGGGGASGDNGGISSAVDGGHGFSSPRGLGSGEAVPLGFARIRSEIIDPFAFQLCILAAAFATGYAMQQAFIAIADLFLEEQYMRFAGNIPLFLFTLLGGWVVREVMHLARLGHLIDARSMHRLTGIAMEFLIVAALATLRIDAAVEYIWPVLILLGVGVAWCAFCLIWLARRLLPRAYWFELGLINYGMSTATTAQGLMLLRIVDPDLESGAAEDYAAAAPLSAPFIGGGVLTVLGIPVALQFAGYWPVIVGCALVIVGLYVAGRMLAQADDDRAEPRGFAVIQKE